jgi:hypothetical protein
LKIFEEDVRRSAALRRRQRQKKLSTSALLSVSTSATTTSGNPKLAPPSSTWMNQAPALHHSNMSVNQPSLSQVHVSVHRPSQSSQSIQSSQIISSPGLDSLIPDIHHVSVSTTTPTQSSWSPSPNVSTPQHYRSAWTSSSMLTSSWFINPELAVAIVNMPSLEDSCVTRKMWNMSKMIINGALKCD